MAHQAASFRMGGQLGVTCRSPPLARAPASLRGSAPRRALRSARAEAGGSPGSHQDDCAPSTSQPPSPLSTLVNAWTGSAAMLAVGGGLLGTGFDGSGPGSVLEALGVLAGVVAVHEAGHFLAARLQGIHVTKFAIGFGPPLLKYQGEVVEYSLRAFPLGGFVAFPDDDPDSPYPPEDPNLMRNRPVLDRIIVTCAGVVANLIAAYAICVVQAGTVGTVDPVYLPGVKLGTIAPGTVAERAGLQRGDLLLQVGPLAVAPSPSAVNDVVDTIVKNPKKALGVKLLREGKEVVLTITPAEMPDGTGRLGVTLGANVEYNRRTAAGLGDAFFLGAKDFMSLGGTVTGGLYQILTKFQETAPQVSGPVAILAVGSEVARSDVSGLYRFAAIINLNLAVVNILPLPALDGGYLALQLLEVARKKKLDVNVERGIMASGFLLLTSLGLFLIVKDAINLTSNISLGL